MPETGGVPPKGDLGGAPPGTFGCPAVPETGGLLAPDDRGAGPLGDVGCPAAGALGERADSPDMVLLEALLAPARGRKLARSSAISCADGRTSASPVHLTTRSATSWGASSGTLHAQLLCVRKTNNLGTAANIHKHSGPIAHSCVKGEG